MGSSNGSVESAYPDVGSTTLLVPTFQHLNYTYESTCCDIHLAERRHVRQVFEEFTCGLMWVSHLGYPLYMEVQSKFDF